MQNARKATKTKRSIVEIVQNQHETATTTTWTTSAEPSDGYECDEVDDEADVVCEMNKCE